MLHPSVSTLELGFVGKSIETARHYLVWSPIIQRIPPVNAVILEAEDIRILWKDGLSFEEI